MDFKKAIYFSPKRTIQEVSLEALHLSGSQDASRLSLLRHWDVAAILMAQHSRPAIIPFFKNYYRGKTMGETSGCFLVSNLPFQVIEATWMLGIKIPFPVTVGARTYGKRR